MKKLFVLAVALALLLVGCATVKTHQNPEGRFTTLAYESEFDPNIFYEFITVAGPHLVWLENDEAGYAVYLKNPDPKHPVQEAVVLFLMENDELVAYGYIVGDKEYVYVLDRGKNRYVKWVPPPEEGGGI